MTELLDALNPYLTALPQSWIVIIFLVAFGGWMVTKEKAVNRGTVEKYIKYIWVAVFFLIIVETAKYFIGR